MRGKVLVTGGAGYIGSHCVKELLDANYEVNVIDNLSTGHLETIDTLKNFGKLNFYKIDLCNSLELASTFKETHSFDAVIHFAAFSQVEESMKNPQKYYLNNICGTLNLLNEMLKYNIKKFIFSSTAAIYGEPEYTPMDELHPKNPINTYGKTKLFIENILDDYDKAYGLKSVRFRYFNVAGAHNDNSIGEWHSVETHLIPNILKATFKGGKTFEMYGTDYDTKDGTCIRDYINVEDLVKAHIMGLNYLNNGGSTNFFNLGTKDGNSVKEIFSLCEKITGKQIPIKQMPRRNGDPMVLVADNKKVNDILGWKPQKTLYDSIKTAYEWEKVLNLKNK